MKKRKGEVKIYYPDIKNQLKSLGNVDHHLKTGVWLNYDQTGKLIEKEIYANGLRNGSYETYSPSGKTLISGNYFNGKLSGEWKYFSDSGNVLKILHYDSLGKQVGVQQTFHAEGWRETYSVIDKNGNEKRWTYVQDDKLFEITNYSNGELNGIQFMYSGKKPRYAGDTLPVLIDHYKNGKLDGEHRKYNGNQLTEACTYKENAIVGYFRKYDGAGNLSDSIPYENNVVTGKAYYFGSGKLIRTTDYINGKKDGKEFISDKPGRVVNLNYYTNGYLDSGYVSETENKQPGVIIIDAKIFPVNKPDSADFYFTKAYYKNKNIKYEYCSRYVNGELLKEGEYKTWYENGKQNYVLNFVNDTMNGVYKKYNTKGELILAARCYNGKIDSVSAIGYLPKPKKKTSYYYQRDYDFEKFVMENLLGQMYFTHWPNDRMPATSSVEIPADYYKPTDTSSIQECNVNWNSSVKPEFPGGENNFFNYIRNNSKYPVTNSKTGDGNVYLSFIVADDGSIHKIETDFYWGIDSLQNEAVRLIQNMPDWIPGNKDGKPVCAETRVEINFIVKEKPTQVYSAGNHYYSPPKKSVKDQIMDSLVVKNSGKDICFFPPVAPAFGVDTSSFKKYIKANLIYPEIEKQKHIEGTVYISFIVETDGTITNVKVERDVPGVPAFSTEAVRVISTAPKFIPGMQFGKPVRVQMVQAVKFKMQ